MADQPSIQLSLPGANDTGATGPDAHDPTAHPEFYDGIVWRRSVACILDMIILCCLFALVVLATCVVAVATLGLISIGALLALPVLGALYDTICIGGRNAATPGMRALGLTVRTWVGPRPDLLQAFLMSVLFWTTVPATSLLVLLFVFFDARSRCLHDLLAGTIVLRVA